MLTYPLILQTIASLTGVATSTSMIIAYRQLKLAGRNSQLTFEDALAREYRQVSSRIPLGALLGEELTDEQFTRHLPDFYWYFDLTNQQVFLRRHNRVSDLTWSNWSQGIAHVMTLPTFARAWERIRQSPSTSFADLRRFTAERFATDPLAWPAPQPPRARN